MEQLATVNLLTAGIFVAVLLGVCVAVLVVLRDRRWAPPRRVSQTVWCSTRGQNAVVDFVERVETGLTVRSVERCSVRGPGEKCGEECRHQSIS